MAHPATSRQSDETEGDLPRAIENFAKAIGREFDEIVERIRKLNNRVLEIREKELAKKRSTKKEGEKMNDSKLKNLVAEAVVLDRQRAEIDKRLKKIKAKLIVEAEQREEEHTPTDNGGSSIRFEGADGCCATVSFPARTLKSSILVSSTTFEKLMNNIESKFFDRLFDHVGAYKPRANFREEAALLLGRKAGQLIKLCESESSPRVSFETKETPAES